jgi:hypothetical protein
MKKHKPYEQNIISFIGHGNYTQINLLDGGFSIYAKTLKNLNYTLRAKTIFIDK